MISNSLSNSPKHFNQFVSLRDPDFSFWHFVSFFLNKHEIERFSSHLKHLKTNLGFCRSWLRRYVCEKEEKGFILQNQLIFKLFSFQNLAH